MKIKFKRIIVHFRDKKLEIYLVPYQDISIEFCGDFVIFFYKDVITFEKMEEIEQINTNPTEEQWQSEK